MELLHCLLCGPVKRGFAARRAEATWAPDAVPSGIVPAMLAILVPPAVLKFTGLGKARDLQGGACLVRVVVKVAVGLLPPQRAEGGPAQHTGLFSGPGSLLQSVCTHLALG